MIEIEDNRDRFLKEKRLAFVFRICEIISQMMLLHPLVYMFISVISQINVYQVFKILYLIYSEKA